MAKSFFDKQGGTYHYSLKDGNIVVACRFNTRGMGHVAVAYIEHYMNELIPFPYDAFNTGAGIKVEKCGDPEPASRLCVSMIIRPKPDTLTEQEAVELLKQAGFVEETIPISQ